MIDFKQPRIAGSVSPGSVRALNANPITPWYPALLGLIVICCESTRLMGADHTLMWLSHSCSPLEHLAQTELGRLNMVLRKSGHFFGYGTLGVVLMQAWASLLAFKLKLGWANMRRRAAALGVASVAVVASLDELHQHFLPNRTGCVSDVLLDTSGSILLITIASALLFLNRRRAQRASLRKTDALVSRPMLRALTAYNASARR